MRRILLCCAAILVCLATAGCWNRSELNELGITVATGFDRSGVDWEMTYQVIVPSASGASQGGGSSGGSQPSVYVFSTKGKTIREAADRGYTENPRRLYFGHTEILVIGKEAAEKGIEQILDVYFRNIDARETVLVAITDGKASNIMRKMVPPEKIPGTALADILRKQNSFSSYFPIVNVFRMAQKLVSDAQTVGVPEIIVTPGDQKVLESLDVNKTTSPPVKMKVERLGVFHKDKLIGYLNRNESYGISWLTNQVKGSTLSFSCSGAHTKKKDGTVRITSAKTKVTPVRAGEHYHMHVETEASGDLLMEYTCQEDLSKPNSIEGIEKAIASEIVYSIETGWEASRKLRADLPGFADKIHRKDPKAWKRLQNNWSEELAQIELEVQVKVKLQRPGLTKKSFDTLLNQDNRQE
ncbi:Ger(x)C family spore germination protein [Paenibacillus sp. MBLB2552]|uniref:Ger(X)C family spore germination protein n=1 Tax=Paenibacillus mellifer TaxID=2937794 RepID=A0A9X1Y305_9BACL|nr:Ger(x)C family spore germination protein [Paenibacillus mellifer]MCK8488393.1 Ger(x)C family spore germination protein [Paenibacillus mellifer]